MADAYLPTQEKQTTIVGADGETCLEFKTSTSSENAFPEREGSLS